MPNLALAAFAPSGDLGNFMFFSAIRAFLLDDDGLITQWTAGMAERLGTLLAMLALPLLTSWIMLHGYRIVSGRSREPMMALVVDAARAALIVFVVGATSMGNPWLAARINELDQLVGVLVSGERDMDGQIREGLAWMQFALSSIDALPTGGDAAVATARERSLWFAGIGTAGPVVVGGTLLMLLQIVLRFLVAVAPLAVMCLLFRGTRPIFQRWLQYCFGSLFRLAVTAVMTSVALKMVCAVAAAFWADKLLNAAVQKLSNGAVDLHMAEGVSSMALQQGGLGLIMTLLIVTVPQMTAEFFMGALGQFSAYSMFGRGSGSPAASASHGYRPDPDQAPAAQRRPHHAGNPKSLPNVIQPLRNPSGHPGALAQDVIKRSPRA
ncbi:type IV secretion system protein [Dyella sp. 2RAB6]|uniref:type IV secretion system protein n=1 Tax=Dyella sp. 2RAB6 TaxID=3232992 RepID=UPI003F910535